MDYKDISEKTVQRYSQRYHTLGKSIKALGWGSEQQQLLRFSNTLRAVDFNNKSVVDIGCGFADYYKFLKQEEIKIKSYSGIDITPGFIKEASKSYPECNFIVADMVNEDNLKLNSDIGVMLGLLNYRWAKEEINYSFSERMIEKAFALVNDVLIVDFLSSNLFEGYPKEDFVFYHDPSRMLNFALTLSSNVTLLHDYTPIPQKEFMLCIHK